MGPKNDPKEGVASSSSSGGAGTIAKSADMSVKLRGWDGTGGAAECIRFIRRVEAVKRTGNLSGAKAASAALAVLTAAAENYIDRFILKEDDRAYEWDTLKDLLKEKYCKPMSIAETERMVALLFQKNKETIGDFRDRCEIAFLSQDLTLPAAHRRLDGYQVFLELRIKQQFLKGMRQAIRQHIGNVDPDAISLDDLETAAKRAETMAGYDNNSMASTASTSSATADVDEAAAIDEFKKTFQTRFGYQPNVAGRGGGKKPQQQKALCGRCGLYCKHKTDDCWVDLNKLREEGRGKFRKDDGTDTRGRGGRGAGRGGRGRGGRGRGGSVHESSARDEGDNDGLASGVEAMSIASRASSRSSFLYNDLLTEQGNGSLMRK